MASQLMHSQEFVALDVPGFLVVPRGRITTFTDIHGTQPALDVVPDYFFPGGTCIATSCPPSTSSGPFG
jgi:hypothetical protein